MATCTKLTISNVAAPSIQGRRSGVSMQMRSSVLGQGLSIPSLHTQRIQYSPRRNVTVAGLFGLGVPELVVIAGVAVVLFGPKQLPEVGKSLGKTVKSFQEAAKEFQTELKNNAETPEKVEETTEATKAKDEKKV